MKLKLFHYIKYIILLTLIGLCASCKTVDSTPIRPEVSELEVNSLEESSVTPEGVVEDQAPPGVPIIETES